MMGMAAVLIYNVVGLTTKYLGNPISVKVSVDNKPQLTFPAVAICNMSPVKKSSLLAAQNAASAKRRRKRAAGRQNHRSFSLVILHRVSEKKCPLHNLQ